MRYALRMQTDPGSKSRPIKVNRVCRRRSIALPERLVEPGRKNAIGYPAEGPRAQRMCALLRWTRPEVSKIRRGGWQAQKGAGRACRKRQPHFGGRLRGSRRSIPHTTTIDEFCRARSIEGIDVLKMDVQGAESMVTKGN